MAENLCHMLKEKNKDNPQTLRDVTSNCNELTGMLANRDEKVWYFSRYEDITYDHNTSEQKLPSWKGFHHLYHLRIIMILLQLDTCHL